MKLYKRGNTWWGRWSIQGERFQVSSGSSDELEAKEILAKRYSESFRQHRLGERPRATWAQARDRYIKDRPHLKSLDRMLENARFWDAAFEKYKVVYVDQITSELALRIRDELARTPKTKGKNRVRGASAINRRVAFLRGVVNAAYREYGMFETGAVPPLFRMVPGERERMRFLTPEEVGRLVEELQEPINDMARLSVSTGLRLSNVMNLMWHQVEWESSTLRIDGRLMKNGNLLRIPLNASALEVLNSRLDCKEHSPYVFWDRNLKKPTIYLNYEAWQRGVKRAGLTDVRFHDLRHTWASWLRQSGVPLETIQELGGWSLISMVQRYAHQSVEHLRAAAMAVDSKAATNLLQSNTDRPKLYAVK